MARKQKPVRPRAIRPHTLTKAIDIHMASRNAMEVCIFLVLFASSVRTALGIVQLPGSLHYTGFPWGQVAASTLCFGCLVSLTGLFWPERDDGIAIEGFGLALAAFGCLFYAVALIILTGLVVGAFAIGMSCGISLACVVRWAQIQLYVRHRRQDALLTPGNPHPVTAHKGAASP